MLSDIVAVIWPGLFLWFFVDVPFHGWNELNIWVMCSTRMEQ